MNDAFVRSPARRDSTAWRRWLPVLALAGLLAPHAGSAAAVDRDRDRGDKGKRSGNAALQGVLTQEFVNVNNVLTVVQNNGMIGQDLRTGGAFGFFPANSPNNYIFGSGLVVAGTYQGVNNAFTAYDPSAGASEASGGRADGSGGGDILCSDDPADLPQWYPEFSDASGNPIIFSQKDCIVIYNQDNFLQDVQDPLPIEIEQRSMAFTFGLLSQVVFVVWDIRNVGTAPIEDAFVGIAADMDLGSNAADDRCSAVPFVPPGANNPEADTVQTNLGICWDNDFNEADFDPNPPGFVGLTFFQGPVGAGGDTLGLTRFTLTTNPSQGRPQPDPSTDSDWVDLVRGIGVRAPFIDATATDVRLVELSGPIQFAPDETQRIVVGYLFANVSNGRSDLPVSATRCFPEGTPCFLPDPNDPALEDIIRVQRAAQVIFDAGFLAPGPPAKPQMTLIPGDRQITVVWSDISGEPDPFFQIAGDPANPAFDPLFREFDFEGFVLVRSTSGDPADVDTVAVFDLANDVVTIVDTTFGTFTIGDSVVTLPTAQRVIANLPNTGLEFSFVDRGLINGIVYFYDVVPFDFNPSNTLRGPEISLSSGISFQPAAVKSVRPRSDATSFQAANARFEALTADGEVCDTSEPTATVDPATGAYTDLIDCSNAVVQATLTPLRDLNIPSGEFFFVIDSILPGAYDPTGANTDTGEPGYIIAEGINTVWYHWEDATGALTSAVTPNVGSFTQGTLFVSPRFNVGTQIPVPFQLDSDASDVGGDLAIGLVVAKDFSVVEDLEVNGQSLTLLGLGGEDNDFRPHAVVNSSLADYVLLSFDREVGALREYAHPGDYAPGSASFELTWSVSGGTYTGTLRQLPGGEVVPPGGQPKGTQNPSTPADFIAGYNWGFVGPGTGSQRSSPFAGGGCATVACGTVQAQMYPEAGPLNNSMNLSVGANFGIFVPGHSVYVEGIRQLPQDGDVWTFRIDAAGDRDGHGREPNFDAAAPFSYEDDNQGFIPELVPVDGGLRNVYPGARWRLTVSGGSNDPAAADLALIKTVPNPYVANAAWDFSQDNQRVEFINLPPVATIRIYTVSGNLVRVIEHTNGSGTEVWDLRTRFNLKAASGTYYWHVATPDGRSVMGLTSLIQNEIGAN